MNNRLAILIIAFALMLTGCATSLVDLRYGVNRTSETFALVEPALEKERTAAGAVCFTAFPPGDAKVQPCLDGVNVRWRPVEVAVAAMYAALVTAQQSVGIAEAAAAIGRAPMLGAVVAAVARAIDAAMRLDAAVASMRAPIVKP